MLKIHLTNNEEKILLNSSENILNGYFDKHDSSLAVLPVIPVEREIFEKDNIRLNVTLDINLDAPSGIILVNKANSCQGKYFIKITNDDYPKHTYILSSPHNILKNIKLPHTENAESLKRT